MGRKLGEGGRLKGEGASEGVSRLRRVLRAVRRIFWLGHGITIWSSS